MHRRQVSPNDMFLSMKKARFGQFALILAGFLAVSGSFGLHPEPEPALGAAMASAGAEWHAPELNAETSPHACVACLSHRSISLPPPAAVVLQPASAVTPSLDADHSTLGRLEVQAREGRAPPLIWGQVLPFGSEAAASAGRRKMTIWKPSHGVSEPLRRPCSSPGDRGHAPPSPRPCPATAPSHAGATAAAPGSSQASNYFNPVISVIQPPYHRRKNPSTTSPALASARPKLPCG
jgi:hypothetical protein